MNKRMEEVHQIAKQTSAKALRMGVRGLENDDMVQELMVYYLERRGSIDFSRYWQPYVVQMFKNRIKDLQRETIEERNNSSNPALAFANSEIECGETALMTREAHRNLDSEFVALQEALLGFAKECKARNVTWESEDPVNGIVLLARDYPEDFRDLRSDLMTNGYEILLRKAKPKSSIVLSTTHVKALIDAGYNWKSVLRYLNELQIGYKERIFRKQWLCKGGGSTRVVNSRPLTEILDENPDWIENPQAASAYLRRNSYQHKHIYLMSLLRIRRKGESNEPRRGN